MIFCVISIFVSLGILVYAIYSKRRFHYRFTHNYPYELLDQGKMRYPHLAITVILLTGVMLSFIFGVGNYSSILSVVSSIFMSIGALLILPIIYIEVSNPKTHLIFSYLFFLFTLGGCILCGLSSLIESPLPLVPVRPNFISIIFLVLSGIELLTLINPKLWKIVFLEKCEEDGKIIYVRPKFSILSTYEWLFIGFNLIELIIVFISTFFYSL